MPYSRSDPARNGSLAGENRWDSDELLHNLLESFPNGSINVFDEELRYLLAAGTGLEQVGLSPGQLIGRRLDEVFPREAVEYVLPYYRQALSGASVSFELAVGDEHYSISAAPLRGPAPRIIAVAQNITERKRTEEALRQARARAEEANRLKDEFLATVSHELRTPLNAIIGWSYLLTEHEVEKAVQERGLRIIHANAEAQTKLIDDLLDVSRLITGKLRVEMRPVDLAPVVEAAVEAVRPAAQAKGIELRAVVAPDAGRVSGDPDRLLQVLWNLLSNAIKFSPAGSWVEARLAHTASHVEIAVEDNGHGIAPDFLPHVFDRFRQQDMTYTRVHGGLGLGLAIVRHLVELHGGTVEARSEGKGQGAMFAIRLPAIEAD